MPVINEYLTSIGAYVDSDSFKKAQKFTSGQLDKMIKKWRDYAKAVKDGDTELQGELLDGMNGFEKAFGESFSKMSTTVGELQLAFKPLLITLDVTKASLEAIYDLSSKVSNQFVTMGSLFVDKDVRDIMAMTGVGTIEAQGIRAAEELTGIGMEELAYATPQQQKMFTDFIEQYTESINSLDPGQLEQFTETTQEFQRTIAESKLKLQLAFMKTIIATGPQLESLFDTITDLIDDFSKMVESDAFQTAAKLFVATIEGVVEILSAPFQTGKMITDFFSGSGNQTNQSSTNNNITINSNAEFQGNPSQYVGVVDRYTRDNALYIAENVRGVIK